MALALHHAPCVEPRGLSSPNTPWATPSTHRNTSHYAQNIRLAGSETNSGLLNRSGVGCHLNASGAFGGPVTKTIGGAVGGNVGGFGHAAVTVGQAVLVSVRMGRGVSALDGSGFQDSVAGEGATNSSEAA